MAKNSDRGNAYYLRRLRDAGHYGLLDQIEAGEITVYEATKRTAIRKVGPRQPAAVLSHHWRRASDDDRKRFVLAHVREVNRVLKEIAREGQERQAKKPSE